MTLPHALRRLFRQPGTAIPAIVLVALAGGVSTGLFTYLAAWLWPRIEAPRPDRVVNLHVGSPSEPRGPASFREYELLRGRPGLASLVAFSPLGLSVGDRETTQFAWSYSVSAGYFELFGARPQLGRLLQPADDRAGAPVVAVLHASFWRAHLGADASIVGRTLLLNGKPAIVVGIAPDGFQGQGQAASVYFPLAHADELSGTSRIGDPEARWLQLTGRLRDGWNVARLESALQAAARAADAEAPREEPRRIAVLHADRFDETWAADQQLVAARTLFAGAVLFLVLAAASITNLLLTRTALRRREWEIRGALGETRGRMALRVFAESGLISLAGGLLALPVALALGARLEAFYSVDAAGLGAWSAWTRIVRLDGRTCGFALLAAAGCGLVAALACLASVLRDRRSGALVARGAAVEARGLGGRRALVAVQVALSLALCLGGGLLARSLQHASRHDPGYRLAGLHIATLYAPRNLEGGRPERIHARLRDELERSGWAQKPSFSHVRPLANWARGAEAAPAERPDQLRPASYNLVSPGYFDTLGIPILAGRAIDERDGAETAPSVVVANSLARRLWGGAAAAMGHSLVSPGSPHDAWQVVGVVADVREGTPDLPAPPAIYFPATQRTHARMSMLLRSPLPAAEVAARLRETVHRVHPGISVIELTTAEEARRHLVTPQRLYAEIASLFALLGSTVAMVGLFGLLSQGVVAGGRDLAVRLAVGATSRDLLRLVAGNALRIFGAGAVLGVALWIPLSRWIRSLLFGVQPLDPGTLLAAPLALVLATLLAALWPALRAARTDPGAALRQE